MPPRFGHRNCSPTGCRNLPDLRLPRSRGAKIDPFVIVRPTVEILEIQLWLAKPFARPVNRQHKCPSCRLHCHRKRSSDHRGTNAGFRPKHCETQSVGRGGNHRHCRSNLVIAGSTRLERNPPAVWRIPGKDFESGGCDEALCSLSPVTVQTHTPDMPIDHLTRINQVISFPGNSYITGGITGNGQPNGFAPWAHGYPP
jgi:hypothetical protein